MLNHDLVFNFSATQTCSKNTFISVFINYDETQLVQVLSLSEVGKFEIPQKLKIFT